MIAHAARSGMSKWTRAAAPQPEGPQPEIHYAPRENLESVDIREIGRAQLSIDMAAYVLSDPRIITALTEAAERGVVIRLYSGQITIRRARTCAK